MNVGKATLTLFALLCVCATLRSTSIAQIRPIYDQGALGLSQMLKRLNTSASALMIGAHPDDEDTALLAYLARGENARTAYLSLTRGDGGQNILGQELGEALGVIRTEELLQARKLDGAEQFFTSAYDYGFSKTLDEAKRKWDEKRLLCEVVRVIRDYRPLVVIAQFNGTSSDGHGQHQFAGYISPLAVKAAGDGTQCRNAGQAWSVSKFYVRHRGQGEPTLRINTGKYDPLLGRSYFEIAMHARSQHRSQEQGVLELRGDQFSNLNLVESKVSAPGKENGIFDGLDLSVRRPVKQPLDPQRPELLVPELLTYHPEAIDLILRAAGIRIDILADRETTAPMERFPVAVRLFVPPNGIDVKMTDIRFSLESEKTQDPTSGSAGPFRRETANQTEHFTLKVGEVFQPTQPYWLIYPRLGDHFTGYGGLNVHEPFNDHTVRAMITLMIGGKRFTLDRPVQYRFADDIRGEIRRDLNVVPAIDLDLEKDLMIVSSQRGPVTREISVKLTNHTAGPASGSVWLKIRNGWIASPAKSNFTMTRKGESTSVRFRVDLPPNTPAGSYEITAEAQLGVRVLSDSMQTISYEHIQTHRIYRPARVSVKVIDLQTSAVKVGYIKGSGDRVAEAIAEMGFPVEEIDDALLGSGDLSRFGAIVVGIRAYQVRPALVSNNQRLLEFARNGGTLIVQYQLPATYSQQNLTPFPAQIGPRVSDETAAVTLVQPAHPILNYPNKITPQDFEGWVQERNLYNFSTMDPKYVGLLESHDAGEPENRGGLVVADVGSGKFVYCSYSLFRQLPAGVPGAYRLLANILSLPAAAGRAR